MTDKKHYTISRRELKMLYTVAILAPMLEGMMLFDHYTQRDLPARIAMLGDLKSCKQELSQCTAAYLRRQMHFLPDKGV